MNLNSFEQAECIQSNLVIFFNILVLEIELEIGTMCLPQHNVLSSSYTTRTSWIPILGGYRSACVKTNSLH
jgi:hypothetical protein